MVGNLKKHHIRLPSGEGVSCTDRGRADVGVSAGG